MNKKILISSLIVAVAALGISYVAFSTQTDEVQAQLVQTVSVSGVNLPIEHIADNSLYAIVGEVTNIVPVIFTDPGRAQEKIDNEIPNLIILDNEILSDVTFKVEEDLFGKYSEEFITVRIPGGETSEQITKHDGFPKLNPGERVILFVGHDKAYNIPIEKYAIMGGLQGTILLGDTVVSKYATDGMTEMDIKNKIKSLKNMD